MSNDKKGMTQEEKFALLVVLTAYLTDEYRDWLEQGKPADHIYVQLETLQKYFNRTKGKQ